MTQFLTGPSGFYNLQHMNTDPTKINMSLGTAQQIMKQPDGYLPHIAAAARLIVAKWKRRARKAAHAKTVTPVTDGPVKSA